MFPDKVTDNVARFLSRNEDKAELKETEAEAMIRILRVFRDHKEELERCKWEKARLESLSGQLSTRHNIRNLLSVPDLVQWYTRLIEYKHYDQSNIFSGKFVSTHMMHVHGRVSDNAYTRTVLM